jgi:hypothetical protein
MLRRTVVYTREAQAACRLYVSVYGHIARINWSNDSSLERAVGELESESGGVIEVDISRSHFESVNELWSMLS